MNRKQHKKLIEKHKWQYVFNGEIWLDSPRIKGILAHRSIKVNFLFDIIRYDILLIFPINDGAYEEGEAIEYHDLENRLLTKERNAHKKLQAGLIRKGKQE